MKVSARNQAIKDGKGDDWLCPNWTMKPLLS